MPGPAALIFQGPGSIEPAGGIPGDHEVLIMASRTKSKRPVYHSPKQSAEENDAINGMIKESWKNGRSSSRRSIYAQARALNTKTDAEYDRIRRQSDVNFEKGVDVPGAKWVEKDVYVGDRLKISRQKQYAKAGRWFKPGDKHYNDVEAKFYVKLDLDVTDRSGVPESRFGSFEERDSESRPAGG